MNWKTACGSTVNTSFPFRRDLTGPSCSGFNLNSLRATTLKSAKALASTSTPVASLVVFALLHITNRPIVRLAIQNFAVASDHRNQTIGVFIAGVPSPPPSLCFFSPNSLPSSPSPPLYTSATQASFIPDINLSERLFLD